MSHPHSTRRWQFSPGPLPTLAAALALAATGYLGTWQQGRAAEKRGLQALFDSRAAEPALALGADSRDPAFAYRAAIAEGEWHAPGQVYVDNRVLGERAGFHVLAPLKLAGTSSYVLVNRGWVPRGTTYPEPPPVELPPGKVRVMGTLANPSSRFLELSDTPLAGRVWQNLTVARYAAATKLDLLPFVLMAGDAPAPLVPVRERPDAGAAKHVEYMLTWYALAATVLVLWVAMNLTRATRAPGPENP